MNAHKAAIKTAKARRANIRDERYWMKACIREVANQGKECMTRNIYYAENLDWLKENGFKYTEHPYYKGLYLINWKDC